MALPKRLPAYADVHTVLEMCVKHGGGRIKLDTAGKARHWCQRANYYRKLLHADQARRSELADPMTTTPYDAFSFRRDKDDESIVVIGFMPLPSSFTTPEGLPVDLTQEVNKLVATTVVEEGDELLATALDFAKKLTEGDDG